jgi:hypothetical protein
MTKVKNEKRAEASQASKAPSSSMIIQLPEERVPDIVMCGILTYEDIVEVILQRNIEDEDDIDR